MQKNQKTIIKGLKSLNKSLMEDINDFRMGLMKGKDLDTSANASGKLMKGFALVHERQKFLGGKGKIEGLDD